MKELIEIQAKLKAPKKQFNSFGNYKFRSCEDILEAVKPLLQEQNCTLLLSDSIELVGDRYYVKAQAAIMNESGASVSVTGYAREEESKKGMDSSQITGTASSYARKYALNGLFCIDDTQDADTQKPVKKAVKPKEELTPEHKNWNKCVIYVMNGHEVNEMRGKYVISDEIEKKLVDEAEYMKKQSNS